MYVTVETIITASAVLGAITAFVTLFWKLFRWIEHQKEQDTKIAKIEQDMKELKEHHDNDTRAIHEEQTLVVYGLLSCLKGLQEQGCDGPVSEAVDKLEKHLNKRAHGQG